MITEPIPDGRVVDILSVEGNDVVFSIGDKQYKGTLSNFASDGEVFAGAKVKLNGDGVYEVLSEAPPASVLPTAGIGSRNVIRETISAKGADGKDVILTQLGEEGDYVKLLNHSNGRVIYVPKNEFNSNIVARHLEVLEKRIGRNQTYKVKSPFQAKTAPSTLRERIFINPLMDTVQLKWLTQPVKSLFVNGRWKATLPIAAIGLIGAAVYHYRGSSEESRKELEENKNKKVEETNAFLEDEKQFKFTPGSNGEKTQQEYLQKISDLNQAIAQNPLDSEEDVTKYLKDSFEQQKLIEEYNSKVPELQKDLQDPSKASEFQRHVQDAVDASVASNKELQEMAEKGEAEHDKGVYKSTPSARTTPREIGGKGPSAPKFKSQKISIPKVLGGTKTIEIGDLPVNEQFRIRNLILPLIEEGNPAIMAFIDPANAGTGYFEATEDPVVDLKKDLRFMAQQGLTNPAKIRSKLKEKFNSRDDRRALRKSRRFYRKNRDRDFSSQYIGDETETLGENSGILEAAANDGFTSQASRMKKLQNIFKQSQISINNQTKIMNKQAQQQDSFIDSYFKDAVKGVEDSYAKAYFAGLNSVQSFDSKKEPDYSNLYNVHKETGEDLILSAHPTTSKPVEAKGDGGVVENALEQHRKMLDIAFNVPSGNFRSKHAFIIGELVKIANSADESGNLEAASLIDEFLQEFVESK